MFLTISSISIHINNLYVFKDASTKAYEAVMCPNKANQTCLAMSKSCLVPVKSVTLAKVELMHGGCNIKITMYAIIDAS